MNDTDALFRAICKKPKDFTRYLIYADLLDDSGKPLDAECWRLLGEYEKYPAYESPENYYTSCTTKCYYWWNCWDEGYSIVDHSVMPTSWLQNMTGEDDTNWQAKGYHSRDQAFIDAVKTYLRLKVRARDKVRRELSNMANKGRMR